ncbi:N-acetylmuramoyl-L-alanine amidase family protein [Chitinophaga ginsengisoli]|uniref:N-acetylmuramoyl-L-alanine amidase n=1 Tax=Chitinophaga ginsengisoli TaxID=363837 RepID=A0A2P8GDX9_9BACT|nr:N-acetylmuramoyl-L-alanine amidase [Chitinophaga ginsengisoli]PSL32172.1 N-acetylmuramoyl-L-alanine amidase [Chitinophaga ginsengisoli]
MRWNRFWIFLGCAIFLGTILLYATNRTVIGKKQNPPLRTIIIDPGHSAQTPGARGKYSTEEGVVLDVAMQLGKLIEANMKDVRVVYTRKTRNALGSTLRADLNERAIIANREKGDLFISIHCNSAGPTRHVVGYKTAYIKKGKRKVPVKRAIYATSPSTAQGTETYVWATGKNNAKTESLKESSSVIMLDANSEDANSVLDMSDPETFILLNTLRNAYFDQSLRLSTLIEDEFSSVGRISRGARQRDEKGIWVLQATAMPSVLVELGFISNPEEEDYLNSASGQQEAANCIFKAIKRYKDELGRYSTPEERQATPASEQSTMEAAPISYNSPKSRNKSKTPVVATKTQTTTRTVAREVTFSGKSAKSTAPTSQNPYKYDVQLLVSDKKYTRDASIFNKLRGTIRKEQVVMNSKKVNKYKYIWGSFKSRSEANAALRQAKQLGFRKAALMGQGDEEVQLAAAKAPSPTRTTVPKVSFKYDVQLLVTDKRYTRSAPIFNGLRGTIIRETVVINRKSLNKYIWVNFKTEKEANAALTKAKKAGFWNASLVSADNIASR